MQDVPIVAVHRVDHQFQRRVNVYEVSRLGPLRARLQRSASRGYTKFVGRHSAMDGLKRALDLGKSGRGQIVSAVAEPGAGQSRLFDEVKARNQAGRMVPGALSFS